MSKNGSDGNIGTKPNAPFRTLKRANEHLNSIRDYLLKANHNVIVNVAAGKYYDYEQYATHYYDHHGNIKINVRPQVLWTFSLPNNTTTIKGAGRNSTIFSGNGSPGPTTFIVFARHKNLNNTESRNIVIRDLMIRYYHTGLKVWGTPISNWAAYDNITVDNVYFYKIGRSYDDLSGMTLHEQYYKNTNGNLYKPRLLDDEGTPLVAPASALDPSRAAIYMQNTDGNSVINSRFVNITNDTSFHNSYANYGGLHAIYVSRSQYLTVHNNYFKKVYARGVVKLRDFSNYARVSYNRFLDQTSLLSDQYCDHANAECKSYGRSWAECPSYGMLYHNNRYKYESKYVTRPLVNYDVNPYTPKIEVYEANEPYCQRKMGWENIGIPPNTPRIIQYGNRHEPNLN